MNRQYNDQKKKYKGQTSIYKIGLLTIVEKVKQ
jgi:hypothetical protein